jgi:hypothetical protein
MTARIDLSTFNVIRRSYIKDKHFNRGELALQLHIDRDTAERYVKECQVIEMLYPKRLPDMHFRIPVPEQVRPPTDRHKDMIALLPLLISQATVKRISIPYLWKEYKKLRPGGFGFNSFESYYPRWRCP